MTCDEPAVGLLVHGARLEGDRLTGRRGGPEHGKVRARGVQAGGVLTAIVTLRNEV